MWQSRFYLSLYEKQDVPNHKQHTPLYLSDLGLVFFCLGADLAPAVNSLGRASADSPPLDCSPILCLSYSLRITSDREGGGWNVTGALIGVGSSCESVLLFLRREDVGFFLSTIKRKRYIFSPFKQWVFNLNISSNLNKGNHDVFGCVSVDWEVTSNTVHNHISNHLEVWSLMKHGLLFLMNITSLSQESISSFLKQTFFMTVL